MAHDMRHLIGLVEGRVKPPSAVRGPALFHGTGCLNAAAILNTGHINASNDYSGDWDIEEEWRLMGNGGLSLAPYLLAIHGNQGVIEWWIKHKPSHAAQLRKLLAHPLLRC
jgi:hypothetical protein